MEWYLTKRTMKQNCGEFWTTAHPDLQSLTWRGGQPFETFDNSVTSESYMLRRKHILERLDWTNRKWNRDHFLSYIYIYYLKKCNSSGAEATPANEEIPSLTSSLLLQTFRLTRYGGHFFVFRFILQIKTTIAGLFPVWTRRRSREQLTGTLTRSLPCRQKAAAVAAASCQPQRSNALYSQTLFPPQVGSWFEFDCSSTPTICRNSGVTWHQDAQH